MLSAVERTRLRVSKGIESKRKSALGQFFTPARTARFMAGLFAPSSLDVCRLLDPGAGIGSLSSAFLERCVSDDEMAFDKVSITAYELDELLHEDLKTTLASYSERVPLDFEIVGGDFIERASSPIFYGGGTLFTHAILNPPYKKINSNSCHRSLLRRMGIETVNLYSAFVALTLTVMAKGGQVVAIIPRSFCNGPYYLPFRRLLLKRSAIRHVHLFESRNSAFRDDDVLQENIIIVLECDGKQRDVKITTSTDDSLADLATFTHPFDRIVFPDDPQSFIHVPTSADRNGIERSTAIRYSLEDIGIQVSTGPVVDFRLKAHLRPMPELGTVPLLYPSHFVGHGTEWPKADIKKANAIHRNAETERWLFPAGFYCVTHRFSSKEEKRRITAGVVLPDAFTPATALGFENHLNVFHEHKHGLPEHLARGLAAFLNTTAVDESFRRFNGHTQVNATDLRLMKYPSREALIALGRKAKGLPTDQRTIDLLFQELTET